MPRNFDSRLAKLEGIYPPRERVAICIAPSQNTPATIREVVERELAHLNVEPERAEIFLVHLSSRRGDEIFIRKPGTWIVPYNFTVVNEEN